MATTACCWKPQCLDPHVCYCLTGCAGKGKNFFASLFGAHNLALALLSGKLPYRFYLGGLGEFIAPSDSFPRGNQSMLSIPPLLGSGGLYSRVGDTTTMNSEARFKAGFITSESLGITPPGASSRILTLRRIIIKPSTECPRTASSKIRNSMAKRLDPSAARRNLDNSSYEPMQERVRGHLTLRAR